jgi:hypothetical protein
MAIFIAFEKKKATFLGNSGFEWNKCWQKDHFLTEKGLLSTRKMTKRQNIAHFLFKYYLRPFMRSYLNQLIHSVGKIIKESLLCKERLASTFCKSAHKYRYNLHKTDHWTVDFLFLNKHTQLLWSPVIHFIGNISKCHSWPWSPNGSRLTWANDPVPVPVFSSPCKISGLRLSSS